MKKIIIAIIFMVGAVTVYAAGENERATSVGYVTEELETRQDKFQKLGADTAMTYSGSTDGAIGSRAITGNLGAETNTSATTLPTVGAVNTKVANKQDELDFAANTVLMNTGVAGAPAAKGIYDDSGSYAEQADSLIEAATFNSALQNAINSEFTCAERKDPNDPTSKCLLFNIFAPVATQSPNVLCTPARTMRAGFDPKTAIMINTTVDTRNFVRLFLYLQSDTSLEINRYSETDFYNQGDIWLSHFTTGFDTNYLSIKHNGAIEDFRLWFTVEPSTEYTFVAKALSVDTTTVGGMQIQIMLVPGNYTGNEIIPCGQNIYVPQNQN